MSMNADPNASFSLSTWIMSDMYVYMYVCIYVCMYACMYQELLKNHNKFLVCLHTLGE